MERNKQYTEKTIENTDAYFLCDVFETLWNAVKTDGLSGDTIKKYHTFIDSLYEDAGHLKCDELIESRIVEYGCIFK